MEEKRKDTGNQPAASSAAAASATATVTATPPKQSDTAASEQPSSRRRGQKRKGYNNSSGNTSNSGATSSKRQAREKLSAVPFPPIHNGPCTRARQSPNTAAAAAAAASFASSSSAVVKNEQGAVVPLEFGGGKTAKAAEEELKAAKEDLEALEGKIEAEYEIIRSRGTNAHVVPIHCGWFSWTKVHPLEERALPSFFNGKSQNQTPEIYMEIRNWIMNKFHANPNTQIELKDLSELSVGELDARQEVMDFLDHWGLINFHPLQETDSVMENADANGAAKMDSLVEKLYCFETEQSCAPVPRTNVATPVIPSRFFPESAVAEELMKPEGPSVEYHCNSCSADCSRKRYHCQKQADFDLCTECFNNGKFGSDMSPSDFILMEPAEVPGVSGGKWTDQETLLLLEALELYKENWNEIAEHVATKTKAQCILHFVQMPIEDTFLDCDDEIDASSKENADPVSTNNDSLAPKDALETTESKVVANENQMLSSPMDISKSEDAELEVSKETSENFALKALTEAFEAVGSFPTVGDQLSFAEAANPVMALAAFLVGLVDPSVATASTRNSLKTISSNSSGMHLAARHCFLLEDPPEDKKKSVDSERSVVQMVEQQDAEEDDNQNDGKQKEKKSDSVLDGCDMSNDNNHEKDKDSVTEENGQLVSPSGECIDDDHAVKEPNIVDTSEDVAPVPLNETDNVDLSKDQALSAMEESNDLISKDELLPSSVKESEASGGRSSPCAEAPKDADAVPLENEEPKELVTSNSMVDSGAITGEEEAKDSKNANEDPSDSKNAKEDPPNNKNANLDPLESKNANADPSKSENANEDPSDRKNANEDPSDNKNANEDPSDSKNANEDPSETKNDHGIDKIKRAAVSAISAAAVKAKILANQEEDQIRQLATLLIEKQLLKLENKLAFFSEMENLVMRGREQLDRSRQRLYHERAQIIATRLGLPASSSRPMQQSLPINRVAMGFANAAPRPPMSMTSQRPPVSRPIMTSGPPTLNPFVPAATAANSVRPSNQDKLSSIGMK
ncbi:SWI/SNF complex subunit SWI3D [Cornus florida]|uniref:SWI/SNF complex subunit SWI3D n=1 Tax=Cornus florida TaxID=4283 RepID=UPI00289A1170|nr:SWI/SNF complex subunit SWI3D [Cornus florida]